MLYIYEPLGLIRPNMENVSLLKTRYSTNARYATVMANTTEVNNTPVTSEEKNSSNRYPLITITRAATSHETIYKRQP